MNTTIETENTAAVAVFIRYEDVNQLPLWYRQEEDEGVATAWQLSEDFEPDPAVAAWRVYIRIEEPSHSGYCSQYRNSDEEECDEIEYVSRTECRAFPADTWEEGDFRVRAFAFEGGCVERRLGAGKSGACRLLTRIQIVSIELVSP